MNFHSEAIPVVVVVTPPDLGDAMAMSDRDLRNLGAILTEAVHVGMAFLLDKAEARWMAEPAARFDESIELDDYATAILISTRQASRMMVRAWTPVELENRYTVARRAR